MSQVNHGEAFVRDSTYTKRNIAEPSIGAVSRRICNPKSTLKVTAPVLLLLLSGCVHVHRFNQRQYDQCVAKHGGETSAWHGLPLTCKPQVWHCKPDGTECEER